MCAFVDGYLCRDILLREFLHPRKCDTKNKEHKYLNTQLNSKIKVKYKIEIKVKQ